MIGNQRLATAGIVIILLQLTPTILGFAKYPVGIAVSSSGIHSLTTLSTRSRRRINQQITGIITLPLQMSILPGENNPNSNSKRFYGLSQPIKHPPTKNTLLGLTSFTFPTALSLTLTNPVQRQIATRELLAGLVVALATIPTSVAYSSIVGLSPMVGIWSSAITGLVVSVVGGGPGMIAGAAGVIALPMAALVASHGTAFMGLAILLAALLETLFGVAKLGKLAAYVTEPVLAGFLNAFALFLVKSQVKVFVKAPHVGAAVGIAGLCVGLIQGLPLVSKALPSSLLGLVLSSFVARQGRWLHLPPLATLADVSPAGTFVGGWQALPVFVGLPAVPYTVHTLGVVGSVAVGVAMISILETLLASRIARDAATTQATSTSTTATTLTSTTSTSPTSTHPPSDPGRLLVGLGLGNLASALFGGFGGCGLIPNTVLNGRSGGTGPLSTLSYSLFLALAVLSFAPLIGTIPLAALAGLMLNVAFNTFEWAETGRLVAGAWAATHGWVLSLRGKFKGESAVASAPISGSGSGSGSSSTSTSASASASTSAGAIAGSAHHAQSQPYIDLVASALTTYLCVTRDMGLGVAVGVLVSRSGGLVRGMREKVRGVGK